MKIIIRENGPKVPFAQLAPGNVFTYNGARYVKTHPVEGNIRRNALCLETNFVWAFVDGDIMTPHYGACVVLEVDP